MDGRRQAPYVVVDDDSYNIDCSDGDRNDSHDDDDDDDDHDDDDDDIIDNGHTFLFNPVRHHNLANTTRAHSRIALCSIFCLYRKTTGRQRSEWRIMSDISNAGCTRVSTEKNRKVGRSMDRLTDRQTDRQTDTGR